MQTCNECGREFKNLGAHVRLAHPGRNSSSIPPAPIKTECAPTPTNNEGEWDVGDESDILTEPETPRKHKFVSPHAKGLVVVMRPEQAGYRAGPGGLQLATMIPGKKVCFVAGEYTTDDQEIIDYFNHTGQYSGTSAGYQDRRYPVMDMTAIGART